MPWPVAHGPDIAHYQNITGEPVDPTWRLCSHKCSEGEHSGDATFPVRWAWMRAQGFKYRGAYHWLRSDSPVVAQVANVIRRIDNQGGLLQGEFIQSDWETTPGITVNRAEDEREFCDRLEQRYGRACTITYSSDWIPDSLDDPDTLSEFYEWLDLTQGDAPLWFANYNTDPLNRNGGQQECVRYGADVWQFTSSFKHPSIVSKSGGGFDMNHVLRWETLDRIAGYRITEDPDVIDPVIIPLPEEEADMLQEVLVPKFAAAAPWYPYLACFDSGVVRPLGPTKAAPTLGSTDITDEGQYRRLCAWAGIQLETEMPAGVAAPVDVTVTIPPMKFAGTVAP